VFGNPGIPLEGVVYEGDRVPGIAIGDTRAEVYTSYGNPSFCQSYTPGDNSFCTYNFSEGSISVRFQGADGGDANDSNDDILFRVYWSRLPGWVTRDGINTEIAFDDPDVVIEAYPNAVVTYNSWGIYSIVEYDLGISFHWLAIPYPLLVEWVQISIFTPYEPPEPQQRYLLSTSISMELNRKIVTSSVKVLDDRGARIYGATVFATWTFPDGTTDSVTGTTDTFGDVQFEVRKSKGLFNFTINDITKDGYVFDPDNSVLTGEIEVGGGRGKKK
jgi:hypothetical protein